MPLEDRDVEVVGLLTTVNSTHDRVAMHSTRRSILEAQARTAGLPLHLVQLPWPCSNEIYENAMRGAINSALAEGVTHLAFGDLFLEDVRAYRTRQLAGSGLQPLFPIWQEPTHRLARQMVDAGVEACLTCVDPKQLSSDFAGRRFDHALLDSLPEGVDPCSEVAGPIFRERVAVSAGDIVEREGFWFADLVLANA